MSFFEDFCSAINPNNALTYIDIGAMGGVSSYWQNLSKYTHVIGFEPDEREFAKLKSSKSITYLPYALFHSAQEIHFYIARDSGKSSIYRPNLSLLAEFPDSGRCETVEERIFPKERVKTLDQALWEGRVKDVDFIKLDTQGSELDVLKGALLTLGQVFGLEAEVEFVALYQGQHLFRDIDAFLDAHGFQLMDLRRHFWKRNQRVNYIGRGQLVFGDALYMRRIDVFLNGVSQQTPHQITDKIRKAVTICMIYRIADYALALLEDAHSRALITAENKKLWTIQIQKEASSWGLPYLWGRSFLAKAFNRCAEILRPSSHLGWSDGDRFIGNIRNI